MKERIDWRFIKWLEGICLDLAAAGRIFLTVRQGYRKGARNPELARLYAEQRKLLWKLLRGMLRLAMEIGLLIAIILSLVRG